MTGNRLLEDMKLEYFYHQIAQVKIPVFVIENVSTHDPLIPFLGEEKENDDNSSIAEGQFLHPD